MTCRSIISYIIRLIVLLIIFLIISSGIVRFIILENDNLGKRYSWFPIIQRIKKAETQMKTKTVYIGDSVGNQLFDFYNCDSSLVTNGNTLLIGQYILLKKLIENNPQIDTICFIMTPYSIGKSFNVSHTTNYFIKPYFSFDNLKYIDLKTYIKMLKKPLSLMYVFYSVKALPVNNIDFTDEQEMYNWFSGETLRYLPKIHKLCMDNSIVLKIISPPLTIKHKKWYGSIERMRHVVSKNDLEEYLGDYINTIEYYPDSCFSDGIHFSQAYLDAFLDNEQHRVLNYMRGSNNTND